MELEKIVVRFYDELENGHFMGRKCPECGAVSFPPYIACNACGCPKTEWYEISGKAEMYDFIMPISVSDDAELTDFKPYAPRLRAHRGGRGDPGAGGRCDR